MVADIDLIENYLDIEMPSSPKLVLDDSRRITGPSLLWEKPGALLDILIDGFEKAKVIETWKQEISHVLEATGWTESKIAVRQFENGISIAISAPLDLLYSAVFVIETSWHLCAHKLLGSEPNSFENLIADLVKVVALEKNPTLIDLGNEAQAKGIDILCDDDHISLGHGKGSDVWPVNELPKPDEVDWESLHNLPVALITGTNGKSTSVRLATAIAEAAGLTAGSTSTDFVKLGDDILDRGDYSGPGGARMLLRDKRLEIAFLEVARGGILRRGLALTQARAALVTNIAADHLGQYGVNTVETLAEAKFAVARALAPDGILVANADDDLVVRNALTAERQVCWFSLDDQNALILSAKNNGNICCWLSGKNLHFFDGKDISLSLSVDDIPVTMSGAARFNIQNAMGALCLSKAMGVPGEAIKDGLTQFVSSPGGNPGRCNEFVTNGARVFVDFAHNPHAISAISQMISDIPAKRRYLLIGHAGDRSDQDIIDLTRAALTLRPDVIVATEIETYLRGREVGEVTALIATECVRNGTPDDAIVKLSSPSEGAKHIIDVLEPGDLALMLALDERDQIFEMLEAAKS
jgi:UDP-N-acetylmuramyl tripeptide synthase